MNALNKNVIFFSSLAIIASLLIAVFFYPSKKLQLIPLGDLYDAYAFDDGGSGGNSSSQVRKTAENEVAFTYQLAKGFAYPYSGISIEKIDSSSIDLKDYDQVIIKIESRLGKRIPLTIQTKIDKQKGHVPFQYQVLYDPSVTEYKVPLSKFAVPKWWYEEQSSELNYNLNDHLQQIISFNIENCALIGTGKEDHVHIEQITFTSDDESIRTIFATVLILLLLLIVSWNLIQRKKRTISYLATKTPKHNNNNFELVDFIQKNYMDPAMGIDQLKDISGFSEKKISADLKSEMGMSFKQFLNQLRIEEAKRLLKESELSISEIAYQIGYNNVSHFNRVFKSLANCSPTDFREKL